MTGYAPPFDGVKTLHDLWESTCSRHSDEECLGTRDVAPDGTPGVPVDLVLHEASRVLVRVRRSRFEAGDHVGMYSVNTAEWCVLDSAMTRNAMVSVPPRYPGPTRFGSSATTRNSPRCACPTRACP